MAFLQTLLTIVILAFIGLLIWSVVERKDIMEIIGEIWDFIKGKIGKDD